MHVRRFAGVVAVHRQRIVLVRERHEHWGGEFWNVPSGMVASHETPVLGAVRAAIAVDDPDGLVREARWFPRDEAIDLLRRLPYRPLVEPVVAYLEGRAEPGVHWHYDTAESDPVVTSQPPAPSV